MWPNMQETVDLVTFAEEILNEKFHLCAVIVTVITSIIAIAIIVITATATIVNITITAGL